MDNLIIFGAKYLIFIIVLVVLVVWLKSSAKTRWQFAAAIVLAGIAAFFLSKLAGALYYHPRPFIGQHITPLVSPSGDNNSFPSDHTLLAATLAAVVYFYRRRVGIALFILAVLVGLGRVLAHVHWTVDIIGGLILGTLAGWAGYQLAKRLVSVNDRSPKSKELESHL